MSRGRASQQAVDESARSAERGRDAEAVAVGPGWPVCNAHRLREAQGTRRRQAAGHVIGRRFFSPVFFGRAKKIGSPDRAKSACDEDQRRRVPWRTEPLWLQVAACRQRIALLFRPEGRAPFARPKGAEKGGCHCSGRRAYGATTALRCSPPPGGSETRPLRGLKQPTR